MGVGWGQGEWRGCKFAPTVDLATGSHLASYSVSFLLRDTGKGTFMGGPAL